MNIQHHSLRALRHRNFRLYFMGHAVSTLGTWIQQVALAWLIYRLTGSAALLGLTTCVALLPQLIVGPLAGAWIDRHDKRRLVITTETLLGAQAMTLAVLAITEWLTPPLIVAMATLMGILNAFAPPAPIISQSARRQSRRPIQCACTKCNVVHHITLRRPTNCWLAAWCIQRGTLFFP